MDIKEVIFSGINKSFRAALIADRPGTLSGIDDALSYLTGIGLRIESSLKEGDPVDKNSKIIVFSGSAEKISNAEEKLAGFITKPSGIATAAKKATSLSHNKFKVVCGSFKKINFELKKAYRKAVETGGACSRIFEKDKFVYLDKTTITMNGGIRQTLDQVNSLSGFKKVVQIHNSLMPIEKEVNEAIAYGADVLMVDTGKISDLELTQSLVAKAQKDDIKIAFSGDIKMDNIESLCKYDIDMLCIGKEIIDAPMLDVHLSVVEEE